MQWAVSQNQPAGKALKNHRKVAQILELHKRLPVSRTDHDHQLVQRQIDATDRQIAVRLASPATVVLRDRI